MKKLKFCTLMAFLLFLATALAVFDFFFVTPIREGEIEKRMKIEEGF